MIRHLLSAAWHHDKLRLLTAALSLAAATALLVWTLGLAYTTWQQGAALAHLTGRPYDCWVATGRAGGAAAKGTGIQTLGRRSPFKTIAPEVIDTLRADPAITELTATAVIRCQIDYRPEGRIKQGPGYIAGLASLRDFPQCPFPQGLSQGVWPAADSPEPQCVLSRKTFRFGEPPPLGSMLTLVTPQGRISVKLAGYLADDIRLGDGFPSLFATESVAQAALPELLQTHSNLLLCKLDASIDPESLRERIRTAAPNDDSAQLVTRQSLLAQYKSDAIRNLERQVPLLIILACVAAACMIVNALCIGIEQRHKLFIRLRAIGMTLGQLRRLIISEALCLALIAWFSGLLIGGSCLAYYVSTHSELFPDGLHLGTFTPLTTFILLLIVTLLSLPIPLRRLSAIHPAETLSNAPAEQPLSWKRTAIGTLCLLPILLTVTIFPTHPVLRSAYLLCVGLPLHIMGIRLILPALMRGVRKLCLPLCASLLRLRPELIAAITQRDATHSARMAITLTIGLGSFFAIHIWGASMMEPFIPSVTLPPAIASFIPQGIATNAISELRALPELKRVLPFTANQYVLTDSDIAHITTYSGQAPKQNNVLLIGVDTQQLFGQSGCLITRMFSRQTGLKPGDTFSLIREDTSGQRHTLPLTINGIIDLNWHLVTARSRLRGRNGAPFGTLGPVFVAPEVAQAWDPDQTESMTFAWIDFDTPTGSLYEWSDALEAQLQTIANKPEYQIAVRPFGRPPALQQRRTPQAKGRGPQATPPSVQLHLRDEISAGTLSHGAQLIGDLARIPLWSLAILSIGFISLLSATIRAQRPVLSTLRALGMTRSQFMRLLFTHLLLTVMAAIVLSVVFGFCLGWSFTGWTHVWFAFQGLPVVFIFPWGHFAQGVAFLLTVLALVAPVPIYWMVRHFSLTHIDT